MSKNVDEKIKNEIFISGLPYEATEDEIREFFKDCGTIT
jgi:RNA recognition motif-containing protein